MANYSCNKVFLIHLFRIVKNRAAHPYTNNLFIGQKQSDNSKVLILSTYNRHVYQLNVFTRHSASLPFIKCNWWLYWIVLFSVAFDFTCTLKYVFLFYSKHPTALICLWSDGHMFRVLRAHFFIDIKFAVLSNEI